MTMFNFEPVTMNFRTVCNNTMLDAKRSTQSLIDRALASIVHWVLDREAVQRVVIVHMLDARKPLGRHLNRRFDDAQTVDGLEKQISDAVDEAMGNYQIDADDVQGLEREIKGVVESQLEDNLESAVQNVFETNDDWKAEIVKSVLEELVERMKA
jgi:hypothetical protein